MYVRADYFSLHGILGTDCLVSLVFLVYLVFFTESDPIKHPARNRSCLLRLSLHISKQKARLFVY